MEPEIRWTYISIEVLTSIDINDYEDFKLVIATWGHVVAFGLYFPTIPDEECMRRAIRWSLEHGQPEEISICRMTFTPVGTVWFLDRTSSVSSVILKNVTDRLEITFHRANALIVSMMDDN